MLTFERGKLRIALDVSWKKTQHFEASWTTKDEQNAIESPSFDNFTR